MNISIRAVETVEEFRACEDLQRRVWAMPDNLEVVPLHLLVEVQRSGGLLLGAFDGEELVGLVFGFPGLTAAGKLKHCSHMMGVAPGYQDFGIGYQLKLAQRERALRDGFDLVTWTYDPLETRNAYLNIHKLGALCRTYIRDYYGPLSDGLNVGLPSDRFQVEWWITSERVVQRLAGKSSNQVSGPAFQVNATTRSAEGLLAPGALILDVDASLIQVEIPGDYQAVKAADPGLALAWRLAARQVFEVYLRAGYTVVDFLSRKKAGGRLGYYFLAALPAAVA
jgi:predicted GNAT superfamily acetyltransferase